MEDTKQGIKLNLTTPNSENSKQNTAKQNYDEMNRTSPSAHHTVVKTEVNSPVELNGKSNKYVQEAQASKETAYSGVIKSEKNEYVQSTTPQGLWRKRCEANYLRTDLEVKDSPSKYASLYKAKGGSVRMPFSPSTNRANYIRASSGGRNAWLMNARKIRLQCSGSGQRPHSRSFSQCNMRNRNDEHDGVQQRPRRSLDSAASSDYQFQETMCLRPQNIRFSFSHPYASCSSLYTAPSIDGDRSGEENVGYFEVQPKFKSYQLVGDSLFVRFAEQMLEIPARTVEGSRGIGLCVSGQKSGDLLRRVHQQIYPVSNKIVLLIGTNDILQNIPLAEMRNTLLRLLDLLKMSASRIVLLTLPPIPRVRQSPEYVEKIQCYNDFIRSLQDEVVSVANIHNLYITEEQDYKMEMFERFYGGQRLDLIHLNRKGLEEMHNFLLQNNFVN